MLKLSAVLLLAALGAAPSFKPDLLWQEALTAHARAEAYGPGRTVILIQELNAEGAVVSYERGETRTLWRGATPVVTLVAAEKNGKDASDEWKKRLARPSEGAGGPPEGFDASPLIARYAESVRLGESSFAADGLRLPYTLKAGKAEATGTMRFSADGKLLAVEQRWTKLPILVSAMSASYGYEYHDGALVVRALKIEAEATILFIKKRFRMEFSFSDWQRKP
ncbi:MAG TPA: hypothetical protein DCG47_14060 [Spirochaetaceae bacterium]|jgi:hypothetical protein|nr:hypothetical protein [Spirochaetaceae bacterium]